MVRAEFGLSYSEGGIPVFHPTMAEFRNFAQFVKEIDKYGMEKGVVKVVPPKEWVDSRPQLDESVKDIKIKNPIIQDVNGTGGLYRLQNIEKQKTYDIFGWRKVCEDSQHQPPAKRGERRKNIKKKGRSNATVEGNENFNYRYDDKEFTPERCQELEKSYWKSLTYSSAMYGADMPGSLFDENCTIWNVAKLDNILNSLRIQIPGVNTAYLYCGMWKSTFAWHLEDMDLYSINYIHFGAPKQWYSISQEDKDRFYDLMKEMWPEEYKNCKEFLRHKTFNASPALLEQHGIKVNKVVHYQNEFMITFPYGYHSGFNFDYNVAESVNFATEAWLPYGKTAKKCRCIDDSVGIDVDQLVRWMNGEEDDDTQNNSHNLPTPPYVYEEETKVVSKKRKRTTPSKKKKSTSTFPQVLELEPPIPVGTVCELCPDMHDRDLVQNKKGKYAHRICAQLIPGVGVTQNNTLVGLDCVPKENKIRCYQCGSPKGIGIRCSEPGCKRGYHATCAYPAGMLEIQRGGINQSSDFLCRFHRPKRPQRIEALESDVDNFAYSLLPGDVVQCQINAADIFAGIVEHNNLSENTAMVRILPQKTDTIEVEWKWLRPPKTTAKGAQMDQYKLQKSLKKKQNQYAPNGEKIQLTGFKNNDAINSTIQTVDNMTWVTDLSIYSHPPTVATNVTSSFHIYRPEVSTMSTDVYHIVY